MIALLTVCVGMVACGKKSYAAQPAMEHNLKMQIEHMRSMLEEQRNKQALIDNSAQITEEAFREAAAYMGALAYDGRWQQIICVGDSLTAGVQGGEGVSYENPWPTVMQLFLGVSVENAGIGGSTISHTDGYAMSTRITQCGEADAIFIMGGVNDWLCGSCAIGRLEEEKSFVHDVDEMFGYIAETYPEADVFVVLPLDCGAHPEEERAPLAEFREAERRAAEYYDFYVIDFAARGILNGMNEVVRREYYSDSIHLNTMGYQILGTLITYEALLLTESV